MKERKRVIRECLLLSLYIKQIPLKERRERTVAVVDHIRTQEQRHDFNIDMERDKIVYEEPDAVFESSFWFLITQT